MIDGITILESADGIVDGIVNKSIDGSVTVIPLGLVVGIDDNSIFDDNNVGKPEFLNDGLIVGKTSIKLYEN